MVFVNNVKKVLLSILLGAFVVTSAQAADEICDDVFFGPLVFDNLIVPPGKDCTLLGDIHVKGNLTANQSNLLVIQDGPRIDGNVSVTDGSVIVLAGDVHLKKDFTADKTKDFLGVFGPVKVDGNVAIKDSDQIGAILLIDYNQYGGNVTLENNDAGVIVIQQKNSAQVDPPPVMKIAGNLTVSDNNLPGPIVIEARDCRPADDGLDCPVELGFDPGIDIQGNVAVTGNDAEAVVLVGLMKKFEQDDGGVGGNVTLDNNRALNDNFFGVSDVNGNVTFSRNVSPNNELAGLVVEGNITCNKNDVQAVSIGNIANKINCLIDDEMPE